MAQRMIHYLIGTMLAEEYEIVNRGRFLLGSILPDAYIRKQDRDLTHFADRKDPLIRYYDFEAFRARFREKMEDSLYLGYYMHLVEDVFYRRLIRIDHDLRLYDDPESVRKLHFDYQLLNKYIADRCHLRDELLNPPEISGEEILSVADFDLNLFLQEFHHDFTEKVEGTTTFLTEEILQEFLDKYLGEIRKECGAVIRGEHYLTAKDLAWKKKPPQKT